MTEPSPGTQMTGVRATTIAIASLRLDESPRLAGEDEAHIRTLAESDGDLPPILVHMATMQVIDGRHRVAAARLRGRSHIAAVFFTGDASAAFVRAVEANISHGLPLSLADRRAAAKRIMSMYPDWSDRTIAAASGLSTKTVRAIRPTDDSAQRSIRTGRDGRMRPVDATVGRQRAAAVIAIRPDASVRDIAASAEVSVATAWDVRRRLRNGESPVPSSARRNLPAQQSRKRRTALGTIIRRMRRAEMGLETRTSSELLSLLRTDPSLRYSETGRAMLRWLATHSIEPADASRFAESIPPHCAYTLAELAVGCARSWQQLAQDIWERVAGQDSNGQVN